MGAAGGQRQTRHSIGFTEPLGDPYEAPGHPSSRARWFGGIRYSLFRPGATRVGVNASQALSQLVSFADDSERRPWFARCLLECSER